MTHYWSIWYPKAANTGMLFGRGMVDPTDKMLLHAAPQIITAELYDDDYNLIAKGQDLEQTQDSPICLLTRDGDSIERQDIWPDEQHYGLPVLLPGGEVGILQQWWHADDRKEWRWQVEFYNSAR